jgi:hypothetical protein
MILLSAVGGAVSAYAGPSMCSGWREVDIGMDACLQRAKAVLTKQHFSSVALGSEPGEVYGFLPDYIGLVNCGAVAQKVVFFVTSGPKESVCHRLWKALQDNF